MSETTSYMKQYSMLITCAKADIANRAESFLYAKHHVFARTQSKTKGESIDNRHSNLALLTHQEHYEAHRLLHLLYPKHFGLAEAFSFMSKIQDAKLDATAYASAQILANKSASIRMSDQNSRLAAEGLHPSQQQAAKGEHYFQTYVCRKSVSDRNLKLSYYGSHPMQSEENRRKVSVRCKYLASLGLLVFQSDKFKAKQSIRMSERNAKQIANGKHHWQTEENSERCRAKQLDKSAKGEHYFQSEEHKEANRARCKIQRTCPHCSLTGRGPNMTRYHFDKCKVRLVTV